MYDRIIGFAVCFVFFLETTGSIAAISCECGNQSIAQLFNQLTNQSIIRFLWRKARERGCTESSESRRAAVVTGSINNESQGRYRGGGVMNPFHHIHYSAARVKRVRRKRLYHGGTPEYVVMGEPAELLRVLIRAKDERASFQTLSPSTVFGLMLLLDTLPLKTFTHAEGDFDALLKWALASMIKGEGAVSVRLASREGVASIVEAWKDKRCCDRERICQARLPFHERRVGFVNSAKY